MVTEKHSLLFSGAEVWIEVDDDGRAAIFFKNVDDPDEPVSFDGDSWGDINMFWDKVTEANA